MIDPVRVVCPRCGNWADVPAVAAPSATCNNHTSHRHTRGELMNINNNQEDK